MFPRFFRVFFLLYCFQKGWYSTMNSIIYRLGALAATYGVFDRFNTLLHRLFGLRLQPVRADYSHKSR